MAVLDGDERLGFIDENDPFSDEIRMPYLSGLMIKEISVRFSCSIQNYGCPNRWKYMYLLMDKAISSNVISKVIAYIFSKSEYLAKEGSLDLYDATVKMALERINGLLEFSGFKLKIKNDTAFIIDKQLSAVHDHNINRIDVKYIKELSERVFDDINRAEYDSAITKSRTILEETFNYAIEQKGEEASTNGNIHRLYKQVKNLYSMHTDNVADKRINKLLSGLENIVSAIAEMRDSDSDAHGVGNRRLKIDKHYARLAANSAVTMSDFIIAVIRKNKGQDNY